jgi:hypothetical protein
VARNKLKFKQSDIVRGLKAGQKLGIDFAVTVQPDGSLLFMRDEKKSERRQPPKSKEWPTL